MAYDKNLSKEAFQLSREKYYFRETSPKVGTSLNGFGYP